MRVQIYAFTLNTDVLDHYYSYTTLLKEFPPPLSQIYALYGLLIALLMGGRQFDPWLCATLIPLKWLGNLPSGGLEF